MQRDCNRKLGATVDTLFSFSPCFPAWQDPSGGVRRPLGPKENSTAQADPRPDLHVTFHTKPWFVAHASRIFVPTPVLAHLVRSSAWV